MRFFGLLALLAATTALGGCPSGDGSALSLAAGGPVCGVNAGQCAVANPVVIDPSVPTVNVGNKVTIPEAAKTGDTTIGLESGKLSKPTVGTALSTLKITGPTAADPTAASTAKFEIDTKTSTSSYWPVSKTMEEYVYGSCINFGVDPTNDTQCLSSDGQGTGLGGHYKEYRTGAAGTNEILQVWAWKYSKGLQYRDETGGGSGARNQAWAFSGTKTPGSSMPTSGTAHYTGNYGGTAHTEGYLDDINKFIRAVDIIPAINSQGQQFQTISHNGYWQLNGTSSIDANFATGAFSGSLKPVEWIGVQTLNQAVGKKHVFATDIQDPNWVDFMATQVTLKGTISTNATSAAGDNSSLAQNTVTGTAKIDPLQGWTNSDATMYAAFFGPNADEVTGVYSFTADKVEPIGGNFPIENTTHHIMQQSGVFNACKVAPCY
jgi:C-lobe and N-lobe beta barrels of Tf-binding protein B